MSRRRRNAATRALERPRSPVDSDATTPTMWIQNTNPDEHPIREFRNEHTGGELVEFTENWKAQVTDEVGAALTEQYDFLEATDAESSDGEEDTDSDTED